MIAQIFRFCGVGGFATLVHVSVAMALQGITDIPSMQANLGGFCAALLVSYLGHARFTFGADLTHATQFFRFLTIALIGLATSSGTVWLVDTWLGLGFSMAMAAVAVLVPTMSYLAMRFWVFRSTSTRAEQHWQGIAIAAVLALAVLVLFWGRMINHDTAWYLVATREWIGGAELYKDIVEVNPPLNFYFTLPAIAAADLFGLSDTNAQYLVMSLAVFLSLFWCNTIIRTELDLDPARGMVLLVGIAAAMILPALDNMGQREQVLVIFAMPWLLGQTLPRTVSPRHDVPRAAIAALGVCLKPHFIIFPVAVTLVRMAQRRSLWPIVSAANLTFLAVGLAYVAYVAIVHPAYLTDIAPTAQQIYGAYGAPVAVVIYRISFLVLLLLLPAIFAVVEWRKHVEAGFFAAMALAGLVSYLVQGTGWNYHAIPFQAFGLLACVFILLKARSLRPVVIAAVVAIVGVSATAINNGFYKKKEVVEIAQAARASGEVNSLMVLSTHVSSGPPVALALGAEWVSRYPANWLVPGALNRLAKTDCTIEPDTCAELHSIAGRNRADNLQDIAAAHPDLLVIDRHPGFFDDTSFDWERFMAEDPAWSQVMHDYQEVGNSSRFVYYQRVPARMTEERGILRKAAEHFAKDAK